MNEKKCCFNCFNYINESGKCRNINLENSIYPNSVVYCNEFSNKKNERHVRLFAYLLKDNTKYQLVWYNYIVHNDNLLRVPSEDKEVLALG